MFKFLHSTRNTGHNRQKSKNNLHKKINTTLKQGTVINLSNKALSKTTIST